MTSLNDKNRATIAQFRNIEPAVINALTEEGDASCAFSDPAIYVSAPDGRIARAFAPNNYSKRVEADAIMAAPKVLAQWGALPNGAAAARLASVNENSRRRAMKHTSFLYASPGVVSSPEAVARYVVNMKSVESVDIGQGLNFIQFAHSQPETSPKP